MLSCKNLQLDYFYVWIFEAPGHYVRIGDKVGIKLSFAFGCPGIPTHSSTYLPPPVTWKSSLLRRVPARGGSVSVSGRRPRCIRRPAPRGSSWGHRVSSMVLAASAPSTVRERHSAIKPFPAFSWNIKLNQKCEVLLWSSSLLMFAVPLREGW